MTCGRPSSSRRKSSFVRPRTIFPCLSCTVAKTLTTLTPVLKVVPFPASWAPRRRLPASKDMAENSASRREMELSRASMCLWKRCGAGAPGERKSLAGDQQLESVRHVDQLAHQCGDAELLLPRAVGIREGTQGPDHPDVAAENATLARLFVAQKQLQESEPLFVRAVQILAKNYGEMDPKLCSALDNLASTYREQVKLP